MKRTAYAWLTLLACCQVLAAQELVLYNWPYYLAPEVKALFRQETGIHIQELYYDSDEARNRLLLSEQPPAFDVVVIDYLTLQNSAWSSLFTEKTDGSYSNEKYIDPQYIASCGPHAAPYFWGSVGIAYRSSKVTHPITSWNDLLNPNRELSGHIVMIDDAMDLVSIALKTLGFSINTTNQNELKQAFELLKQQRQHVLAYALSFTTIQDETMADQVYAAVTYSGDFYSLRSESKHKDWQYVAPKEGSPLWIDCLAISKTSKHSQDAKKLVNFLLRPDVIRLNSEILGFAPTLKKTELSEKAKNDTVAYPSHQHLQQSEYYSRHSSHDDKIRNAIYFSVLK